MRYSGVKSFSSVGKAKRQLEEIEWLERLPSVPEAGGVIQSVSAYRLTPYCDGLSEFANAVAAEHREEIAAEREIRKQQQRARKSALNGATRCVAVKPTETSEAQGITEYEPLYTQRSVVENGATPIEAPTATIARASEGMANLPMKGGYL
jgi:hypothetical protein